MNKILFLFIFTVVGCANFSSKKHEKVFDNGLYKHEIRIKIKDKKEIRFLGFNDISDKEMKVVALSPFGTTLLSFLKSSRKETLFYDDKVIPITKTQMRGVLFALRGMYRMRENECVSKIKCIYKIMGESVIISRADKRIKSINLKKTDKFELIIKVLSYEKNN
jgi:hypothetical protein